MAHLIIRNIGPIKNVEIDLNRINVFMGPQSCGKSTIAKIISYCAWFEKNVILKNKPKKDFYHELIEFHNLEDTYFSEDSYIEYVTPCCHIAFKGNDKENPVMEIMLDPKHKFENRKIEYIPAERNFVALKGLGKYTDSRDNILNFLYDWFQAKQEITPEDGFALPLSSLGGAYFYDKERDTDHILLEDGRPINLRHSSSGLMSATPLLVIFDYVMRRVYTQKRTKSPVELARIRSFWENLGIKYSEKLNQIPELQENLFNLLGLYGDYYYSQVIIEEPELNLFPKTQIDLVYYMLRVMNESQREHVLVLTTHSPYILFALNNCMMGGLVRDKIPPEKAKAFVSHASWVDPSLVSVYEIHGGCLKRIQDEDGIIEDNYLNQAYKENSSEYLTLLSYFEDEE